MYNNTYRKIKRVKPWEYKKSRVVDKEKLSKLIQKTNFILLLSTLKYTTHLNSSYRSSYCPKCKNKFSVTIKTDSTRHWFWCHGCDNKGDVLEYIMSHGYTFLDGCRYLCDFNRIDFDIICKDKVE